MLYRWLTALMLIVSLGLPSHVGATSAISLSADQQRVLDRVAAYLNQITTMQGEFLQISSTGETAEGTILLSRPKHLRIEYKPPAPIVIVANGKFLSYVDTELQQINHIPLEDTPAAFLLRDNFSFSSGELTVTALEIGAGAVRVSMVQSSDPLAGELTLVLSDNPMVLRKWTIVDAQGVVTSLTLVNPRFGFPIPDDQFIASFPEFDY